MNAVLLFGLLVAAGVVNDRVNPPVLQIDVVVCQGDPLGSRAEGTIKHLAESCVVTKSGRSAFFRAGTQSVNDKKPAEWFGTEIEVVPVVYANGKVWADVNTRHVEACPGLGIQVGDQIRPGSTERSLRLSRVVSSGYKFRIRIAADSPSSQTWAEVTVGQPQPQK